MGKRGTAFWLVVVAVAWAGQALAETPTEKRLRLLEEQLQRAEREIKELRGQVQQQKAIGQATQKQAEDAQEQAKATTAQAAKSWEAPDWLKRTTLFGDVRVRHDGLYNQQHTSGQVVTANNRERIRARLGVKFALSDELSTTIRVATGNANDPISTNEDLSNSFGRKNVNLDWAYMTLTPGKSFGIRPGLVSMNAGKFPNPIFRVGELVWDDDLSPEGFSQTISLLDKPRGVLDQVRIHALEWSAAEVSNGSDAWMFGGQINPLMHIGGAEIEAGLAQYGWVNVDRVAQNINTNSSLKTTNLLVKETVGGKSTVTAFQSGFEQTNGALSVTFPNVIGAQPVKLFGDYVHNWDAVKAGNGWQAGLRLGQTKVKGDWSLVGYYEQLEQDAVLAMFTYSDFGTGGTNQEGPVIGAEYQLMNPLTLSVKSSFTNLMDRPADMVNQTEVRLLVDAIVKF
jgi:hypothetical protein